MTDFLKPTFSLTTKAERCNFIFRVPTPLEKARQGARETAIRRIVDPMSAGWADGLDEYTFNLIRGMAVLELFLERCDAKWVYSETPMSATGEAKVIVDITKFPPGKEDVIAEVGSGFQAGLDTFHGRGVVPDRLPVPEAVESRFDTGAL